VNRRRGGVRRDPNQAGSWVCLASEGGVNTLSKMVTRKRGAWVLFRSKDGKNFASTRRAGRRRVLGRLLLVREKGTNLTPSTGGGSPRNGRRPRRPWMGQETPYC